MFNVKKNTKQGQCMAMRCKGVELQDGLCERHHSEWSEAGCPSLTVAQPAQPEGKAEAAPLVKTDDALQERLNAGREKAQIILKVVSAMPADTDEDLAQLGQVVNECANRIKDLEAQRKDVTGPINQSLRRINGWFKPLTDTLTAAKKLASDKIANTHTMRRTAQQEALKAIQESKGDAPAETYEIAHATPELPSNIGVRSTVEYAVTEAALVPDEYWMKVIDHDKIKAKVKADGLKTNIPGVSVYEKTNIGKGRV